MGPTIDPERRAGLYRSKLGALVEAHFGADQPQASGGRDAYAFAGGAALSDARNTWVLLESPDTPGSLGSPRSSAGAVGLGATLAWVERQGLPGGAALHVIVDGVAANRIDAVARQAACFADAPTVWGVRGRSLVRADLVAVPTSPDPPETAAARIDELVVAGLDVVIEHGVISGEVLGLEVARVVVDEDGSSHIEVGVGRNDREAFAMMHGEVAPAEAMATVVEVVRRHRHDGAPPHPLQRFASERRLRSHLIEDPARLAGWDLRPVSGLAPRVGVNDGGPALAVGTGADGAAVVLACSTGIDLELVPVAAEARHFYERKAGEARLVLAMPARDAHPVTVRLAGLLIEPAELLPIEGAWC